MPRTTGAPGSLISRCSAAIASKPEANVFDVTGDSAPDDPLAAMVLSYLDDPDIGLRPDDPVAESRANTWCYSLPTGGFDVAAVAATLAHVFRQLSTRQNSRTGTFYCWYDEQAGQLRCSLTSRPVDRLPFGGRYRPTVEVTEVLHRAAADPQPGAVLWEELTDLQDSTESPEQSPAPFPVWIATIS
jgi:hypothetical protein